MRKSNTNFGEILRTSRETLAAFLRPVSAFLFVLFMLIVGVLPSFASGPSSNRLLNYQLRLTDASGIPVADGTYNLKISFYDAATSGTRLATDCGTTGTPVGRKVVFSNGTGSVLIGDTAASGTTNCADASAPNAIPAALFDNALLYLGITVGAEVSEMTPRKRIVATGYSLNADRLDDLETSSAGGSNAFVPVTDSSGNFTLTRNVTVDTDTFFVDATNNAIGIGTVTPASSVQLELEDVTDDNTAQEVLSLHRSRSSSTAPSAADFGADLTFRLESSTNGSDVVAAKIRGAWDKSQTNDTTERDAYLGFYVMDSNTLAERMRVDASGRVGIGTGASINSGAGLHVNNGFSEMRLTGTGNAFADISVTLENTTASTGRTWLMYSSGNDSKFYIDKPGSEGAFTINDSRQVGIGTASPSNQLTVSGNADVTGNLGAGVTTPLAKLHVRSGSPGGDPSDPNMVALIDSSGNATNVYLNTKTSGSGGTNSSLVFAVAGTVQHGLNYNIANDRIALTNDMSSNDPTSGVIVNTSGSVGIGDNTPDALLDVAGTFQTDGNLTFGDASGDTVTSNAAAWTFANDTTVALSGGVNGINFDSNTFSIDASNNRIGIGTAAPTQMLHLADAASVIVQVDGDTDNVTETDVAQVRLTQDGGISTAYWGMDGNSLNDMVFAVNSTTSPTIRFETGSTGTTFGGTARMTILNTGEVGVGDTTPTSTLDVGGTFAVQGNATFGDASGDTVTANAAAWTFANDTAVTLSGGVNGINFDTNTFSIDATNNRVGFGTAAPVNQVDIVGTTTTPVRISSSATDASILFDNTSSTDYSIGIANSGAGAPLGSFYVFDTGAGTARLLIASGGNVGIGTGLTSPLTRLDLAGNLRATGKATAELTGDIDPAASTTVTGTGTLFLTELVVGDRITVSGETRTVTAIATNTSLTVDSAFTDNANDTTPDALYAVATFRTSTPNTSVAVNDLGHVVPGLDDTYDLGSNTLRWRDLYLGPASLHIGTSTSDEGVISYNTSTNVVTLDSTGTVEINGGSGSTGCTIDGSGNFTCSGAVASTSGTAFVNGGNSFAGAATLGTNDANDLNLETSGATRMTVASGGGISFAAASNVSKASGAGTFSFSTSTATDGIVLTNTGATTTGNSAINLSSSATTGRAVNVVADALTTGVGLYVNSASSNLSSGGALFVGHSTNGTSTAFTGTVADIFSGVTYTGGTALSTTGSALRVGRTITLNDSGDTHSITGAALVVSDDANQVAGTISSTGNVIQANQNFANATGAVLKLQNFGTGLDIQGTGGDWSISKAGNATLGDVAVNGGDLTTSASTFNLVNATATTVNVGGAATSLNLAGGSGSTGCTVDGSGNLTCSGTLTSGSAAAFVNGGNSFGGAATLGTNDAFDLNLETSGATRMAITATGAATFTTGAGTDLFNILTGNLKIGAGSPTNALNGDDAYVTGGFEADGATRIDGALTTGSTTTFATGSNISKGSGAGTFAFTTTTATSGFAVTNSGATLTPNSAILLTASGATTGTGVGIVANALTSGTALAVSNANNTTFNGRVLDVSMAGTTGNTAYTSDIARAAYTQTFTAGVGLDSTGNVLDVSRAITLNNASNTHTISGAVATFSDAGTQTAGTLASTADVVRVSQAYTANTGSALNVTTAGSGNALTINDDGTFTDSTPVIIDTDGNLGVGTTSAREKLTLGSGSNATLDSGYLNTAFGGFGNFGNYVTRSEEFDNAAWTKESTIALTSDQTSPDGATNTAERVSTAGASATDGITQAAAGAPASASTTWTGSVWLKMSTGSATVNLRISSGNETGTVSPVSVTTAWKRHSVTQTFTGSSTGTATFRIETGTNTNVVVWGGQLEQASSVGVYVKTVASAIQANARGAVANFILYVTDLVSIGDTAAANKLSIATTSSNDGIALKGTSDKFTYYFVNNPSGAFNPITQLNDTGIFYGAGSVDTVTNGFVIAPHRTTGSGLRMDSSGNITETGNITVTGDVAVNGGDLTTSASTFNLVNATATTVNVGGAATSLNLAGGSGSTGCTVDGSGNLTCSGTLTSGSAAAFVNGGNSFGGAATLGTNDAFDLNLETSGATRMAITATGAATFTTGAGTDLFNVLTGNLKVGNGAPSLALDGEDAYVEGTFEADGAARFDNTLNANGIMNLGDGGDTGAINTSDWDVSSTGDMTGIGNLTADGATTLGDDTGADTLTVNTGTSNALVDTRLATGNIVDLGYGGAATQTGSLVGIDLDLSTNLTLLTPSSSLIGVNLSTPPITVSAVGSYSFYMLRNGSTGNITTNTSASANVNWFGADINLPSITQTLGTATAYGINVDTSSTITTGGTANAFNVAGAGVGAGSLNGLNISNITAGAGTERAINIGSGWDAAFVLNGTTIVDGAGAVTVPGILTANGTLTLGDGGDTGAINTSDWDISATGVMTGISGITNDGAFSHTASTFGISGTGAVSLGGGSQTVAVDTSDWDISTTGVMTGIGAITTDGNFSQTGSTTFSTGTNQVSLNGNTVLTGGANLTLTTGTGRYLQTHTDSGNDAFTVNTSGLTTAKAMVVTASSNSFTGGNMVSFDRTATGSGTNHNGNLVNINFDVTTTSNAGAHAGKILNISRSNNNNSGSSHTFSGAVASISDAATLTSGGITHSADVLQLTQGYTSNTGSVLDVTTAGTGFVARFNDDGTLTDSTPFVIDDNGAVSIGGTAPGTSLHILENATAGTLGLTIENDGASTSDLNMFRIISNVGGSNNVKASIDSDGDLLLDGTVTASSGGTTAYAGDFTGGVHITAGTTSTSQLLVEGCPSNGSCTPGQVVAKGTGGAGKGGYFVSDTDNTASESGLIIKKGGTNKWFVYTPTGTDDLGFYSGSSDKFTLTNAGIMTVNATADGAVIQIAQGGTVEGTISVSGTTVSYGAFTGSHYGWTNETIERGMLVSMTGSNRNYHGDAESEILYGISLTSIENDAAVLGSYLAKLKPGLPADDENPHMVMASGNGDAWVVDEGQNIEVGDNLISSGTPGHARKDPETHGVSHVIARASENIDWSTVTETVNGKKHKKITVLYGTFDRHSAGKYFTYAGGSDTDNRDMTLSTLADGAGDYKLSLKNDEADEVAYFGANGDVALRGRMFLSDRGILQNNRYMYYDGSSGPGGDFIRTNAAGWGTGSYDFAEMFPSSEVLEPGDLVMVDTRSSVAMRRAVTGIEDASPHLLAGVVSTRPGFLAGMNDVGNYPIALEGRVPARVTGRVKIGDPITMSATPGVGIVATESTYVVGTALEAKDSDGLGTVTVFVKTGWWNGSSVAVTSNAASQATVSPQLGFMTSNLDMAGYAITTIGALSGINDIWSIDGNGLFTTRENYVVEHQTDNGPVPTYASQSQKSEVTASGNAQLVDGVATITFDDSFRNIISGGTPLKVIVTLTSGEATGVYVTEKTVQGFAVRELGGGTSEATFDWLVIARRKGFDDPAPVSTEQPPESPAETPTEAPAEEGSDTYAIAPTEPPPTAPEEEGERVNP